MAATTRTKTCKEQAAGDVNLHQDRVFLNANSTKRDMVELVHRLAYDDKFRAAIEADAGSVLTEYNVNLPDGSIAAGVTLPSKEGLQAAIGGLDSKTTTLGIGPFIAFAAFIAFISK